MDTKRTFPSKIMLAGEYGVVAGGSALTIPFPSFSARIRPMGEVPPGREQDAAESREYLKAIYNYLKVLPEGTFHAAPDLELYSSLMEQFWLETDIPVGYGLGSSGVASAAVYDVFFPGSENLTLTQQRNDLAAIESFFHGKSSGVDALTCYKGIPLYFTDKGEVFPVEFDPSKIPGGYFFFLLDSAQRLDTGPLVAHFLEQMNQRDFAVSVKNEYLVMNQKLIETLLGERDADPGLLVRVLSDFQFTHFRKMIPDHMVDIWIEGQVSGEYYLKLNGSGGGYLLGITHESQKESLGERWKENLIWIT